MPTALRLAATLVLASTPAWAQAGPTAQRPTAPGPTAPGPTVQRPTAPGPTVQAPTVQGAWARATAPHQSVGAAYLTLTSPVADRLVSVTSPDAAMAMLHSESVEGGVMRMREQPDGIALAPGTPTRLAPGGEHVMLMGLHHPLVAGQHVTLHLAFRSGAALDVAVPVRPLGAGGPG